MALGSGSHALCPDHSIVVRALQAGDRERIAEIFARMGPHSRVQRFLGAKPVIGERDVSILTRVDGVDRAGVIAFAGSPPVPVGAAHSVRTDPVTAEIAIEVVDDWQRRGVGRRLLAELKRTAAGAGVRRLEGLALESNDAAAALARRADDSGRVRVGDGVVAWQLAIS